MNFIWLELMFSSISISNCRFLPSPDDTLALDIAYTIYMKFEDLASALRIALLLDNKVSRKLLEVVLLCLGITFKLTCISMICSPYSMWSRSTQQLTILYSRSNSHTSLHAMYVFLSLLSLPLPLSISLWILIPYLG